MTLDKWAPQVTVKTYAEQMASVNSVSPICSYCVTTSKALNLHLSSFKSIKPNCCICCSLITFMLFINHTFTWPCYIVLRAWPIKHVFTLGSFNWGLLRFLDYWGFFPNKIKPHEEIEIFKKQILIQLLKLLFALQTLSRALWWQWLGFKQWKNCLS